MIGNTVLSGISAALPHVRSARAGVLFSSRAPQRNAGISSKGSEPPSLFQKAPPKPPLNVGFGQGTVSGPTAAVQMLRGGLDSARRIVPSLEETRARVNERLEEQRERMAGAQRRTRPEAPRTAPAEHGRQLLNRMNQSAETALARFRDSDSPDAGQAEAASTMRVNGESVRFLRNGQGTFRFDVSV